MFILISDYCDVLLDLFDSLRSGFWSCLLLLGGGLCFGVGCFVCFECWFSVWVQCGVVFVVTFVVWLYLI